MATEATVSTPGARSRECNRLASPALVREALERYPWPLPTRVAVQISSGAALFSTIVAEDWHDVRLVGASLLLGGLTMYGFHVMSRCQAFMRPSKQAAIVIAQILCSLALTRFSSQDMGPLIFLFAISAELQFMMRFRLAIAGACALWVLAVIALLTVPLEHIGNANSAPVIAGVTLAGFVFVAAFTRSAVVEVIQRYQTTILLDELNETHAQLQTYVHQVEELAVTRERNRMAREIHDTLGHYLTVINVQIETAQKLGARDAERAQTALATAKRLASECLGEVRRSVAALRPAALDEVELPEAIGQLVEDWRRASLIPLYVESRDTAGATPPTVEVAVYRALQEALTNVRKHADARNVWLRTECGPCWYQATVRDDGRGAAADALGGSSGSSGGFGLQGMRERVEAVGGTVEIVTAPGAGFALTIRVPSAAACDAAAPVELPVETRT